MRKPTPTVARMICPTLAMLVFGLVSRPGIGAETDWPGFRGRDGSGHSVDANLPVTWTSDDVLWRTELPGQGNSSPCIWGDRIFVTTASKTGDGQIERSVLAIDRTTGKILWRQVASVGSAEQTHNLNGFASPTCTTDGEHVIAFFGRGGLHGYDVDGKKLWSRDLGTFPGPWGTGASPILLGDVVIQNCDAGGDSFLLAVDKRTGETIWRTSRGSLPRGGWNTPIVIDTPDRRELILNGEQGVRGYDPATGTEHWFCKSFNGRGTPMLAFGHGMLFVVSGKSGAVYAVRPGGTGNVTATHMVWHTPRGGGRDLSSPILVGNYVFVVNMSGIGICYDAKTGKELWQERLGGNYAASPIVAGGLIYIQNEAGQTLVIKPGDKLNIVARNEIGAEHGEIFRGTLAPSNGQIFLRSRRAIYCIEKSTSVTAVGRSSERSPRPDVRNSQTSFRAGRSAIREP